MDVPLLIIAALLVATLTAFLSGLFPYPFGLLVLLAFLIARLLQLRSKG